MWCSFSKSKVWMAQISVLTASQAQTSSQLNTVKAARPSDRPTKMYFPDTARQLALPVTYQERENMSVSSCFPSTGHISHTSNIHQQKRLIYSTREKNFAWAFIIRAGEGISSLPQRLFYVGNEKVCFHLPLLINRKCFKGQELRSTRSSHG